MGLGSSRYEILNVAASREHLSMIITILNSTGCLLIISDTLNIMMFVYCFLISITIFFNNFQITHFVLVCDVFLFQFLVLHY